MKSQRKKGVRSEPSEFPFPNFGLRDGEVPTVCSCIYDDSTFLVHSTMDIQILYSQGGFGRSTLTLRAPLSYSNPNYGNQPYYRKARARQGGGILMEEFRMPDSESNPDDKDVRNGTNNGTPRNEPVADADEMNEPEPENETVPPEGGENSSSVEKLELMPEEVIFLSFALGCLRVENSAGDVISPESLWNTLVMKNPEFPIFYAVYHHFRAKNWVPKVGDSYGGDFVLYEVGPQFFHACYIVHIIGLGRPRPQWLEACSRQRCASHASKCALFCEVSVPDDFSPETPMSIFRLIIRESPLYRWTPSLSSS